ncbi:MAG: hypothetical protein K2O64_04565, partial [Lactobacillus sp.]|nr:hypothetical protein [Lactobacillus sp.]
MKRYRPRTSSVSIGITLMVIGICLWVMRAVVNKTKLDFLIPIGLLLLCVGGLTLTIIAFITLHKNDLAMRK